MDLSSLPNTAPKFNKSMEEATRNIARLWFEHIGTDPTRIDNLVKKLDVNGKNKRTEKRTIIEATSGSTIIYIEISTSLVTHYPRVTVRICDPMRDVFAQESAGAHDSVPEAIERVGFALIDRLSSDSAKRAQG